MDRSIFLIVIAAHFRLTYTNTALFNDKALRDFLLTIYEPQAQQICNKEVTADWDHSLDLTNRAKANAKINATIEAALFETRNWQEHFRNLKPWHYRDVSLQRQVKILRNLGRAALNKEQLSKLIATETSMTNIYATARICPYFNQKCNLKTEGLRLEPDIEGIMASSANYDELLYTWKSWREVTGRKMKEQYETYIKLSNEAARGNGFMDMGEMWRDKFETNDFQGYIYALWKEIEPLYNELHKYVLNKLKLQYGDKIDVSDGLIPAHILGNMWAQSWLNIGHLAKPFPNVAEINVTLALIQKGYTPLKMFETADEFYQSLGFKSSYKSYSVTDGALIEKPPNREVICHASAWDFCNQHDFRISMCTEVNFEDFITIHHEMGHIQYYMSYMHQPLVLRNGANPGFHEAIGDTIALSVSTPKHLQKINLISGYQENLESDLNALMDMALERIAFIPFSLVVDMWRWDVFSERVSPNNWNSLWWHYRKTIQKIKPPISRSDSDDFDPGSKFHVPAGAQYISYFIAHVLEFQLHKGLCIAAKQYDPFDTNRPLHKCDIYGSKEAGQRLRNGLSLGASRHWRSALKEITGETELSGSAILEYFKPLYVYLRNENMNFLPSA